MSAAPTLSLVDIECNGRRGGRTLRVLANASLDVCTGEVAVVLAQRSHGKTTLLRIAAGLVRPDAGRVLLDGDNIWGLSAKHRARLRSAKIGWVDATGPSVHAPVLTYVAFPLMIGARGTREAYARARDALTRVGVGDCATQSWDDLADWERALVSVAQGIVRGPELLLVDDVMKTLGIMESEELSRLLADLAHEMGLAVLATATDASATIWSDRVASLAGGELIAAPAPTRRGANVIDFPAGPTSADGSTHSAS